MTPPIPYTSSSDAPRPAQHRSRQHVHPSSSVPLSMPFSNSLNPPIQNDVPTRPNSHTDGASTTRFMKAAIAARAPLVAVTGGLGYLGSHIVARMLFKSYFVRTIVPQGRNVDFLLALPGAEQRLQIIPVRDPAAEDAKSALLMAFRGVSTVVHAASFSTHDGKIPKTVASKRIVDSLKYSLDAASAPGNVIINFIYVSSETSVFDPTQHPSSRVTQLTEDDWFDCTKSSRETTHPFAYAHTVAELRLWARLAGGSLPFNVCSVIPSFLIGPVLSIRHVSTTPSISFIQSCASGNVSNIPDIPMSPVDVRDVARAITALCEYPAISGRMLLCAEALNSMEFILKARRAYPQYNWPEFKKQRVFRHSTGKGSSNALKALETAGYASKDRRGRKYSFSQHRARTELGLRFRPVSDSIRDTLLSLIRFDMLEDIPKILPPRPQAQT